MTEDPSNLLRNPDKHMEEVFEDEVIEKTTEFDGTSLVDPSDTKLEINMPSDLLDGTFYFFGFYGGKPVYKSILIVEPHIALKTIIVPTRFTAGTTEEYYLTIDESKAVYKSMGNKHIYSYTVIYYRKLEDEKYEVYAVKIFDKNLHAPRHPHILSGQNLCEGTLRVVATKYDSLDDVVRAVSQHTETFNLVNVSSMSISTKEIYDVMSQVIRNRERFVSPHHISSTINIKPPRRHIDIDESILKKLMEL